MWLGRHGVDTQTMALHDGSGLSRLNLVTPEATTRLLGSISQSGTNQVFRDTLPIAGTDGTLAGRLRTVAGKAFAKTGSLIYDNSLSGYVINAQGDILAFSIFCNDYTGRGNSARLIDQIVLVLASNPDAPHENSQKSQ
jgi:D-alanyl-D-alanine carboxypeptidase/D-alanyl-D-alanine-endopeptidase (penicillin-binding protein 4)